MSAWLDRGTGAARTGRAGGRTGSGRRGRRWARVMAVALGMAGMSLTAASAPGQGFDELLGPTGPGQVAGDVSVMVPEDVGMAADEGAVIIPPGGEIADDGATTAIVDGAGVEEGTGGLGRIVGVWPMNGGSGGWFPSSGLEPGVATGSYGVVNNLLLPTFPRIQVQVDALMLWQNNPVGRPLFVETAPANRVALDAANATSQMAIGPRVGVLLNLDSIYAIEGNYFTVRNFYGEQSTPHTQGGYQQVNLAGFNFADINWAQVVSTGQIQSAELNWRRRTCGPITWLAGFRWVEWNQTMTVNDQYTDTTATPPVGSDQFVVGTANDLYGGQGGMDVVLWNDGGPVKFSAVGKAGVFYNTALQRSTVTFAGSPIGPLAAAADQTSFFGELGILGTVQLNKWWTWRAGYNFFWLSGVAVPADQLSLTNANTTGGSPASVLINTNGSVLLSGVSTGLEARW